MELFKFHGCYEMECALNESAIDENSLQMEQYILRSVDLLLPVSERYSKMIQEKYPFCKGKTAYLHNGVEKINLEHGEVQREKGRIIAVGGDRKLKNNITVAKAMAKLGADRVLTVYGHLYHPNNLPQGKNIEFKGLVPQTQLYEEMQKSELYILNSVYEPFALSVYDALLCGCSVLITNVAGALELLNVTEHDVIFDPMDENEIANKIDYQYMEKVPNFDLILEKDKTLSFYRECFQQVVGIRSSTMDWGLDANPEEGRLNEEQEIEQISTYLNFYRTNVCFLPKVIPEDIVYDEEYLKKICGAQLFPNLADARDSKEKLFRIANALSLPIGGIEQLLITQFIIKKGEDYQKISELLHMIAEQH